MAISAALQNYLSGQPLAEGADVDALRAEFLAIEHTTAAATATQEAATMRARGDEAGALRAEERAEASTAAAAEVLAAPSNTRPVGAIPTGTPEIGALGETANARSSTSGTNTVQRR